MLFIFPNLVKSMTGFYGFEPHLAPIKAQNELDGKGLVFENILWFQIDRIFYKLA